MIEKVESDKEIKFTDEQRDELFEFNKEIRIEQLADVVECRAGRKHHAEHLKHVREHFLFTRIILVIESVLLVAVVCLALFK